MIRRLAPAALLVLAACAPGGGAGPAPPVSRPAPAAPVEAVAVPTPGDGLAEAVTLRLQAADPTAFRAVSVRSSDKAVLLTGVVTKPVLRRRAEAVAKAVPGVATVYDAVLLAEDSIFPLFLPDAARERALTARLPAGPGRIALRVVGGAAYLVGTVPSSAALARAKEALMEDPDLKWVDVGGVVVR